MFTGLISHIGEVQDVLRHEGGGMRLAIRLPAPLTAKRGDSVAVNGVCLTVIDAGPTLTFDVIPETLARTNLGDLGRGEAVNIEASLRVGDEIGGHLVYGHIDATTIVLGRHPEGNGCRIWCVTPPTLAPLIAEKGSIALDGVSLTVATAKEGEFAVALIPETLAHTTLGRKDAGSVLNVEADPVARYVARILRGGEST